MDFFGKIWPLISCQHRFLMLLKAVKCIAEVWNLLSSDVVMGIRLDDFKRELDKVDEGAKNTLGGCLVYPALDGTYLKDNFCATRMDNVSCFVVYLWLNLGFYSMTGFVLLHSRKGKWNKINMYSEERRSVKTWGHSLKTRIISAKKNGFTVAPEGSFQSVLNYPKADDQVIIRRTYVINDLELMVQISTDLFFTRNFQAGFGRPFLWNIYLWIPTIEKILGSKWWCLT